METLTSKSPSDQINTELSMRRTGMSFQRPRMSADRRGSERLPILGSLHAEVMVYAPMAVLEIGPGGVTVETTFPLHLDSPHDLRLSLGACSLVARGRVTHSRLTDVDHDTVTYRTGLEFVEVPERVSNAIAEYLAVIKAGRAGS
jgi:hypothetical protein